jgi:hypothetical protein
MAQAVPPQVLRRIRKLTGLPDEAGQSRFAVSVPTVISLVMKARRRQANAINSAELKIAKPESPPAQYQVRTRACWFVDETIADVVPDLGSPCHTRMSFHFLFASTMPVAYAWWLTVVGCAGPGSIRLPAAQRIFHNSSSSNSISPRSPQGVHAIP